jgi:hypothetical protein
LQTSAGSRREIEQIATPPYDLNKPFDLEIIKILAGYDYFTDAASGSVFVVQQVIYSICFVSADIS